MIPRFKYEKEELPTITGNIGEKIMYIGLGAPLVILERMKPVNFPAWIIYVLTQPIILTIWLVWIGVVGWPLMLVGLVLDMLEESYGNMKRR